MRTKTFFGVLALASFFAWCDNSSADPLNNWHWRNPLPNGNPQFGAQTLNDIIFTNGTFFAVGNFGVVDTSFDATNWTQTISATSNQLNSIICADGKFVAAGVNGTVETSADGTNWVLQTSGTTSALNSVTYGNGKFVAVGSGAVIASPDAMAWSPAVSGLSTGSAVAGGSFGFVAINGSTNAFFSADGLNWTYHPLSAPQGVQIFSNNPVIPTIVTFFNGSFLIGASKFVTSMSADWYIFASSNGSDWTTNALGNMYTGTGGFNYNFFMTGNKQAVTEGEADGISFLQFSPDGIDWTQTNISFPFFYKSAGAYGNGMYVFVGANGNVVSPDLLNWSTQQYNPPSAIGPTSTFNSIAYSNGTYVVATSSSFVVSTNDSVYAIASNTPSLSFVVAYYNSFVGVGSSGQIYQSTNGFAWYQHNSGTANNLHSVAAGNNLLVAVGDNGAVQTSPTGVIWTSRASGTSLALYGVVYSNGLYVAVGQEGTVVTSSDGITWTAQDSTELNNLLAVTYGSAGFLAVGLGSTMVTSPDGINWNQHPPIGVGSFQTATFGNGYYLVAGTNGLVMTSPDGFNWTARNVGVLGGQTLYGSGFLNGRFDVVGANGTVVESDPVPPLFDLQINSAPPNDVVTAFATPGSNFRILSSTNLTAPSWNTAATFNNAAGITYWTNSAAAANTQTYYRLISP
ncbi:MAG TPA: hypothetical protein VMH87_19065 [Pseudomonadales bacterium]|nr:hypothetical protein [Pseudomonadales bacterium]